jgi:hypothetical protein
MIKLASNIPGVTSGAIPDIIADFDLTGFQFLNFEIAEAFGANAGCITFFRIAVIMKIISIGGKFKQFQEFLKSGGSFRFLAKSFLFVFLIASLLAPPAACGSDEKTNAYSGEKSDTQAGEHHKYLRGDKRFDNFQRFHHAFLFLCGFGGLSIGLLAGLWYGNKIASMQEEIKPHNGESEGTE